MKKNRIANMLRKSGFGDFHSDVIKDYSLLGCDAGFLGHSFPTFRKDIPPSSSRIQSYMKTLNA
jgi:hypothetical protein